MKVCVVIITRNRREALLRNLRYIERFRSTFDELLLVDNASTDDTVAAVKQACPWVRVLQLPWNAGCNLGRNIAAVNTDCESFLSLDDDGCFDFSALPGMVKLLVDQPKVGVLGGRVVELPGKDVFALDFQDYPPRALEPYQAYQYHGGNSFYRRSAFLDIGLLPDFFYGAEERDVVLRMWKKGYAVLRYDRAVLLHCKQVDPSALKRYHANHYRNCLRGIWRNLPVRYACSWTAINLGAGFFSSVTTGNLFSWLRGVSRGLCDLPGIWRRERSPLTVEQYRDLRRACQGQLSCQARGASFLRNMRVLRAQGHT
ncbi:MAG: glycosyltransferase [Lentisphaerae bacterium]|nr:glycosyltransferase [Lentisphaerota bacterium]